MSSMNDQNMFPPHFKWGAATASFQIEGGTEPGARGQNVWDSFCRRPGAVKGGATGLEACDHYNRMRSDVRLMREIGLQTYRFSFSWARLLPNGVGEVNDTGVAFYDQLIDELLEAGIEPCATLFHWDYPYELFLRGGWLNRESVDWFGEYTSLIADKYSDRVVNWLTLNEPPCFLGLGHRDGVHAPGLKLDWPEFFLATKHALMAHGTAVQVLRAEAKVSPKIGYVPISHVAIPDDERPDTIAAAREFTFGVQPAERSFWFSRLYLDPVLKGEWPEECVRVLTPYGPEFTESDLALMNQPIDYLALNFYAAPRVRMGRDSRPEVLAEPMGHPRTGFDWAVTPEGMYWSVRFHAERYGLPISIAENGLSSLDWVSEDGCVHDPQRIDFTSRYLKSLSRAHQEGYEILSYYHWSLMDNFEWAEGYTHRFGLIHVDFATQTRTLKDSAHWYRTVIQTNGASLSKMPTHALIEELAKTPV